MQISNEQLKTTVKNIVEKRINQWVTFERLHEISNFMGARRLADVSAPQLVSDFETIIIKELDLMHPNEMAPVDQGTWHQAMTSFSGKVKAAMVDAIKEIDNLPKKQKKEGV